jgi:hypothetical protein
MFITQLQLSLLFLSSSNFLDFLLNNSILIIILSLGTALFLGLFVFFGVKFLLCESSQCKDENKPKMINSLLFVVVCGALLYISTLL